MKIYLRESVLEAARKRVAWVFDEFEHVIVNFSGGKDSTVVLGLALEEAERRGRLPLPVHWIDQEMEWQATADFAEQVMTDPRVLPRWFQFPFRFPNSASAQAWTIVWDPAIPDLWMRPKHPLAVHDNPLDPSLLFPDLFEAILCHYYGNQPVASIGGVRAEESPSRAMGVTSFATYKWVTWGTKGNPKLGHYNFYPIYDWGFRDVWKAIHEHGWPYCTIYDRMYQYGYRVQDMRVSNLYHETALKHLLFLQEIEPQTWERLTRRLPGIHAIKHLRNSALRVPDELPPMFTSWVEYRDYLLRHLVQDEGIRTSLAKTFADLDRRYEGIGSPERMYRVMVASILVQDGDVMTKLRNWENSPIVSTWRRWKRGDNIQRKHLLTNPHING